MNERTSYDQKYFLPLFQAEDKHFWFITRNRIIANVARRLDSVLPKNYHALELGCGDGNTLRVLEENCQQGKLVGSDLFYSGLHLAQQRVKCPLVQADVAHLPFGQKFYLVGLFDVLEHISDDRGMLELLREILVDGGYAMITVPAEPELWSYFDEVSHHVRRYTTITLRDVLLAAGYEVISLTAFMSLTYPLVWLRRRGNKNKEKTEIGKIGMHERSMQELQIPAILNWILVQYLRLETGWLKLGGKFRKGSSLLVIVRKPVKDGSQS